MNTPKTRIPRVSTKQARQYVLRHEEFNSGTSGYGNRGCALYARWRTLGPDELHRLYVVYSYGTHFPIYIFDPKAECWYGNKDKYSPTTSRHQSATMPFSDIVWLDRNDMGLLAVYGFMQMMVLKVDKGVMGSNETYSLPAVWWRGKAV